MIQMNKKIYSWICAFMPMFNHFRYIYVLWDISETFEMATTLEMFLFNIVNRSVCEPGSSPKILTMNLHYSLTECLHTEWSTTVWDMSASQLNYYRIPTKLCCYRKHCYMQYRAPNSYETAWYKPLKHMRLYVGMALYLVCLQCKLVDWR